MKFDVAALHLLADQQQLPVADVIAVVTQALTDAYAKTPAAVGGAVAVIDEAASELHVLDAGGADVTPADFGRLAAATMRQAVTQWLRDVERIRKVGPWAGREGTVVRGVVRPSRSRRPEVSLDLGEGAGVECVLPDGEATPGEELRAGDRVTVLIVAVNATDRGTVKVTVSRRQPALVDALFADVCEPLRSGAVQITGIARDPGSRCKVAVTSTVPGLDPAAALLGPGAEYARQVAQALGSEKIDLVRHSDDLATFVAAALTPAKGVAAQLTDAARRAVTATVAPDQLAFAAGRRGSNVSLAQRLTGARIHLQPAD